MSEVKHFCIWKRTLKESFTIGDIEFYHAQSQKYKSGRAPTDIIVTVKLIPLHQHRTYRMMAQKLGILAFYYCI